MNPVFGPVHSWRLGRALGVDMVASDRKYCSFDCVYCPGGKRAHAVTGRPWFVGMSALQALLESHAIEGEYDADYVAFTGEGEPTLAGNLGDAIDLARSLLDLPVAVLTNSSLMPRDDVRRDLAKADVVVAKLDAPDEGLFQAINRPYVQHSLAEIVDALGEFRRDFQGRFVVQTTVVEANRPRMHDVAAILHDLAPHEVQLNWRLPAWNTCAVAGEAEDILGSFGELNIKSARTNGPSWERLVDAVQMQRSGRQNAEVMLMAAEAPVAAHHLGTGDATRLGR